MNPYVLLGITPVNWLYSTTGQICGHVGGYVDKKLFRSFELIRCIYAENGWYKIDTKI